MELSKKDKKVARTLIETGLLREFAQGLSRADAILQDWKNSAAPAHRTTYHSLYNMIADFDKHIACAMIICPAQNTFSLLPHS